MAGQGSIRNRNTGGDGNSVEGLNDSDKWHKALPHSLSKELLFSLRGKLSEFLGSSPC